MRGQFTQSQSRRQKAHRTVNSDCPVHHRTVRSPHLSELQRSNPNGWVTWLAHRTVRCAKRSNGRQHNGRVQRSADTATVRGQFAQSPSRRQKAHRTVNSDCPVHHQTIRWSQLSELQRSNPNGWVTWLTHRTVRCAHRQTSSPTAILVVGAINTPQPPHFKASKFFRLHIQYKS